ncbi:hypothetical protein SAMN06296065_106156 [Novosphingobium panipatense]|uniref:Uncharacterized protein n=1 Tax=Novosphingobium panipatense TaxID=428991 RepID=A0ABY1QJ37_9SPHN|nr:hypothetical protein SAMN06296065_106156 [Novosphingobium panipatense]
MFAGAMLFPRRLMIDANHLDSVLDLDRVS